MIELLVRGAGSWRKESFQPPTRSASCAGLRGPRSAWSRTPTGCISATSRPSSCGRLTLSIPQVKPPCCMPPFTEAPAGAFGPPFAAADAAALSSAPMTAMRRDKRGSPAAAAAHGGVHPSRRPRALCHQRGQVPTARNCGGRSRPF